MKGGKTGEGREGEGPRGPIVRSRGNRMRKGIQNYPGVGKGKGHYRVLEEPESVATGGLTAGGMTQENQERVSIFFDFESFRIPGIGKEEEALRGTSGQKRLPPQ